MVTKEVTELLAPGRVTSVELSLFPPTILLKRVKYAFAHILHLFGRQILNLACSVALFHYVKISSFQELKPRVKKSRGIYKQAHLLQYICVFKKKMSLFSCYVTLKWMYLTCLVTVLALKFLWLVLRSAHRLWLWAQLNL